MKVPWGGKYCGGCLNDLFERATDSESNFPRKCCGQVIPLEDTGLFLSWHIYKKFQEESGEYSTTNQIYCSDSECGAFIPPKTFNEDKANCPACRKMTCIVCKAEFRLNDSVNQTTTTAAAAAGFQQSRDCKLMIEQNERRNHVT